MGWTAQDVTPLGDISPITPTSKDVQAKVFSVSRANTVTAVKVELPADASLMEVVMSGTTTSDATTTAVVTISVLQAGVTISSSTVNVKSVATTHLVNMSNLPNLQPVPLTGDVIIQAVYAGVGAETVGGPWYFTTKFVR